MNLLIPIGGTGERFRRAGILTPKPVIKVGKKRLIELALESYPGNSRKIAVVSKDNACEELDEILMVYGVWQILLARSTHGPLETVLSVSDKIDSFEELLIADCDSFLDSAEMAQAIIEFRESVAHGGVTTRMTSNPACSFAKVEDGWVTETREKDPFTNISTTGPYWFRHGVEFVQAAKMAKSLDHYSISPVYNFLEGRIRAYPVASFRHLGTPEELREYVDSCRPGIQ